KFYVTADYLVKKFKNASNGNVDVFANHEQITILNHLNQRVDQINPLICRLQTVLHAPVNYFIMPIFALVNAGVAFGSGVVNDPHFSTIALGIFLGLLCGKPIGIFLFSWISVKLGLANLPDNSNWKQLFAIGIVGGIGFTMSLFIDNLAFVDAGMIDVGKAAILVTSTVAMLVGIFAVAVTSKRS
ncbi:MAG: Na+/H+ antiporter NhaA, partial [Bacteroidaceae bacterium]|nr:Na+/H+ antiporter NhaA [Bacteroidaceae bacterium]